MEQNKYNNKTLGEIVAEDFRSAAIFSEAGIDFCCGGKKSLQQACDEKNLNMDRLVDKLNLLAQTPINQTQNFNEWGLDFLIDYIVNTHHKYVTKTLPGLLYYTQKIAQVHGSHHLELIEVNDLFGKINDELQQHLYNEENVLFPAIKNALTSPSSENRSRIESEISRMNGEHEFAGNAMDRINLLTMGYIIPKDACSTYQVTLNMLKQFEDDLHIHVHLENNILFPKSLKL